MRTAWEAGHTLLGVEAEPGEKPSGLRLRGEALRLGLLFARRRWGSEAMRLRPPELLAPSGLLKGRSAPILKLGGALRGCECRASSDKPLHRYLHVQTQEGVPSHDQAQDNCLWAHI